MESRVRLQRLQLGAEQKGVALPAVIQRLLTHAVTRQRQNPVMAIPQRNREHAHGSFKSLCRPPGLETRQQSFGIRMPPPTPIIASGAKQYTQVKVFINLTIERNNLGPAGRDHRLM